MIDVKGLHDIYQLRSAQSANRPPKRALEDLTAVTGVTDNTGMDVIKISPEAAFRNKLDAAAKSYAQQAEDGVNSARLETLRRKYDGDSCPVSGAATAQMLLSHLSVPTTDQLLRESYPANRVSGDL